MGRILALDGIRITCIFAVILIHTTTRSIELVNLDVNKNIIALFLNQLSRFAVPLLFLISGFSSETSLRKNNNLKIYFQKRVNKMFIPYIFWSLIYYSFVYTKHSENIASSLINGTSSYQLYFIPSLMILYIIFPLLHRLYKTITRPTILTILAIIQLYILYVDYFVKPLPYSYILNVALFNYLAFILGMAASRHQTWIHRLSKQFKPPIIVSAALLGLYTFYEGFYRYQTTKNYLSFYSQWRPSILIYSLLIFLLLFDLFSKSEKHSRTIVWFSENSFFAFFVHVIVIELLSNMFGTNTLLFFVLVIIVTFASAYFVRRSMFIKNVTG